MDKTNGIPNIFCNVNYDPVVCDNVGELKIMLRLLPDEVPLSDEFRRLVVYNASDDPELSFEYMDD